MRKILLFIAILGMAFSLVACRNKSDTNETTKESVNNEIEKDSAEVEVKANSLEDLEKMVNKDVEDTIAALKKDYENLLTKIDTYDKYKANTKTVETFYDNALVTHKNLTIRLREYALSYAEMILSSDSKIDDKYKEMKELYKLIYDQAGEDIYDEIYDGILKDMYDTYYDGIIKDAYDTVEYEEYSKMLSDEYDWWSDTCSNIYDDWSDFQSDVYDFYSDIRSELYRDNIEKANEKVKDFKEDIEKLKN